MQRSQEQRGTPDRKQMELPQEMNGRSGLRPPNFPGFPSNSEARGPRTSWDTLALPNLAETGVGTPDRRVRVKFQKELTAAFKMMFFLM